MKTADKKGNSYIMYEYFITTIKRFSPDIQLAMFHAIANYGLYGDEPDFSDKPAEARFALECAFDGIKANINSNTDKRERASYWGSHGGAPKGNKNASKQEKQGTLVSKQPNVNGNVSVNGNVNGNENVNVNMRNSVSDGSPLNAEPPPRKKREPVYVPCTDEYGFPAFREVRE